MVKNEKGSIRFGFGKTNTKSKRGKPMKPSTWCLFETIERFNKTNMTWVVGINETRRLLTISNFSEVTMKKDIFYAKLMNRPRVSKGKRKNDPNSGGINDETKSLIEIGIQLLGETTDNPTSFMASKRTINIIFVAKYPFATYDVCIGRRRDQGPSLVKYEGFKLF
jgi:hypothetical protein